MVFYRDTMQAPIYGLLLLICIACLEFTQAGSNDRSLVDVAYSSNDAIDFDGDNNDDSTEFMLERMYGNQLLQKRMPSSTDLLCTIYKKRKCKK